MGELVLVLLITWAFKHAWDHSRGDYQKSKAAHRQKQPARQKRAAELVHHDIGYWAHQGTHGFPAFRHGFGKGWRDARKKAATARAERVQATTEHLETRAELEPQIAEHRRRQADARDRIREARQPGEGSPEVQPDAAPQPAQEPEVPPVTTTEGDQTVAAASDVTYDGVIAAMAAEHSDLENRAAEQSQAIVHTQETGDAMQALNLDAATLSAMADHEDAQHAAHKALSRCMETAATVHAVLTRGHQGLAEAHKDAPVPAAEREFYAA